MLVGLAIVGGVVILTLLVIGLDATAKRVKSNETENNSEEK